MDRQVLCLSKSGYYPTWTKYLSAAAGVVLVAGGIWRIAGQASGFGQIYPYLFVGLGLLYFSRSEKKIYLSPEGIVKETKTLLSSSEEVLPWSKVAHVTIATKRKEFMAFFERYGEIKGLRVLFNREQEQTVRGIISKMCPKTEVNTIQK
nr:hypothetical protein [uncultured Dethiosulfovibrio sp.]